MRTSDCPELAQITALNYDTLNSSNPGNMNTESTATIHTIGFTKKTAEGFFELLRSSGTQRVVDVRLNNVSQLAGFSKRDDLRYFLKEICHIDYVHLPVLAPSAAILAAFGKHKKDWPDYELAFLDLMRKREN